MFEGHSFLRYYKKQESGYDLRDQCPGKGWDLLACMPAIYKGKTAGGFVLASERFSCLPEGLFPLLQILCRQLGSRIVAENGPVIIDIKNKTKTLVDCIGEGIIQTDLTGMASYVNDVELFEALKRSFYAGAAFWVLAEILDYLLKKRDLADFCCYCSQ